MVLEFATNPTDTIDALVLTAVDIACACLAFVVAELAYPIEADEIGAAVVIGIARSRLMAIDTDSVEAIIGTTLGRTCAL